jgi:DNA-3-methyladenine glycosylase II
VNARAHAVALREAEIALAAADPLMRALIVRHGPCRLAPQWRRGPYEALVRAVMHQQVHGRAAEAILQRFIGLCPAQSFPAPASVLALPEETLRAVGLSWQKVSYVRAIASAASDGTVPVRRRDLNALDDEAIITRLVQVRGVGRWTVEMLLIFTLGRLDVLPVDDYGVRAGFVRSGGSREAVKPRELRAIGERWAPYRSVAAWYLWRATEVVGE